MKRNTCIAAIVLAGITVSALGRDQSGDNWYFGGNAGVTFVSGAPLPLAGGQVNTMEGCATISDTSGTLLFYTDGSTVWNADHDAMPNGTGLLGNSSASQSGIIVPKPGSSTIYYVFTVPVSCNVGLNYSVVDLTLDSGKGDVVVASKNTQLLASSTEVVTVVPHDNGTDYWVVARECGDNGFSAFHISSAGINTTPVESNTGTAYASSEIGYLKASPNGDQLGMSFYITGTVEYYDFDPATGQASNAQNLGAFASAYGFEFSPDGSKLYVAPYGGDMVQYDLDADDVPASKTVLGGAGSQIGAIQNGPDGKTYFSVYNQNYLGVINDPDTAGTDCDFQVVGPNISGVCKIGLPTFIPAFFASTQKPTLTTTAVTNIGATSADGGGNVTDNGGATVSARGVCWNTTGTPTTADDKTTDGTGDGTFTSELTGLTAETTYYVRAYATNSAGTSYGDEETFTTIAVPTVTTTAIENVDATSADGGGNVTDDGGSTVSARGVCWNTTGTPTTADDKTTDGTGDGTFTSELTGLDPETTYYVRAYATNSAGTSYGDEETFTTIAVPTVTTTAIENVDATSADGGGNVTDDGGSTVSARGVCWNTTGTPTVADDKTTDGTGAGAFISELTGLDPETTYYVRAYATNSAGTGYGDAVSFTSLASEITPDLRVNVAAAEQSADVGEEIAFEVDVQNVGNGDATDVTLRLPLPTGTEFVGAWLTGGQAGQSTPLNAYVEDDEIVVEVGNVTALQDLKLEVRLKATKSGPVTLAASATCTEQAAPATAQAITDVEVDDVYYEVVQPVSPLPACGLFGFATPLLAMVGLLSLQLRRIRR